MSTRTVEDIQTHIAQLVEDITLGERDASSVSPDAALIGDLGLDSLDYARVLLNCEAWLGIKVQESGVNWAAIQTVAQLAVFLKEQASPGSSPGSSPGFSPTRPDVD